MGLEWGCGGAGVGGGRLLKFLGEADESTEIRASALSTRDNSRVDNITWRPVPKRRNQYNFFDYIIIGIMGLIMVISLLPSLLVAPLAPFFKRESWIWIP